MKPKYKVNDAAYLGAFRVSIDKVYAPTNPDEKTIYRLWYNPLGGSNKVFEDELDDAPKIGEYSYAFGSYGNYE